VSSGGDAGPRPLVEADHGWGDTIGRLGWPASSVLHVGNWLVGVRSNSEAADALLRRVFASNVVDGVEIPACYYSVIVGPTVPAAAGVTRLSVLFRSRLRVTRTPSARRVVRALAAHLSSHLGDRPAPGLLRLDAIAAVGEAGGVLFPAAARRLPGQPGFERGLARLGLRLVDGYYVDLDPHTGEVVVGPPAVSVDESALGHLGVGPEGPDDGVGPGRYPLAVWAVAGRTGTGPPSKAAVAAAGLLGVVDRDPEEAQQTLEMVAALAARFTPVALSHSMPEILARVAAALPV